MSLALLSGVGCRSFAPPTSDLKQLLPVSSPTMSGPFQRHSMRVAIDSDALSGEFEAVAATRSAPQAGARLQLFGDLGGKLFDMAVQPDRVVGYFPHAGIGLDVESGDQSLPRHLISFMAASLLEASTPITLDRVRAARRRADGGFELELEPILFGVDVTAVLSKNGELLARNYALRGVRWSEDIGESREFRGGDFVLRLTEEESESLYSIPEGAFELDLPQGFHP